MLIYMIALINPLMNLQKLDCFNYIQSLNEVQKYVIIKIYVLDYADTKNYSIQISSSPFLRGQTQIYRKS